MLYSANIQSIVIIYFEIKMIHSINFVFSHFIGLCKDWEIKWFIQYWEEPLNWQTN